MAERIRLLERHEVSPEIAAIYDALLKQRGVVPNMFRTLAHTPALAVGIAAFLKGLLSDGALAGWYKELIATRLSVLLNSTYAVTAHAISARQKGASVDQIEAARADFESGPFTEAQKMGFRCAERMHRSGHAIDDQFYAAMKSFYNDQQIIELTATAAAFEFFPRFVDGLRIPTTPAPQNSVEEKG
ncbi:MAG TPA: carboxymuconolactone decarboxylase family protein [Terriglobales bacterium]|nr:carboxymuconolactone decarboxylase family protein [Terriglobales bacterium]